ncbi:MAG: inorganic triphosphatase [Deinococcales bacterium]
MAIERELKLTGVLPKLDGIEQIAGVRLEFLRTEQQQNRYFDLPDLRLRCAGKSLRLRHVLGKESVFTFKGASAVHNGWHQKQEIEVPAHGATQILELQAPEILAQLGGIDPADLIEICRFDTVRRVYELVGLGELCLDDVQILRGEDVLEQFSELELEALPSADEQKLQNVARVLMAMGRLEPSAQSKSARALAASAKK